MIKAVTLDLWNTLIEDKSFSEYRIETIRCHLEEQGISRKLEDIQKGYRYATNLFEKEWK